MSTTTIPHRFSERAFRRYEDVISQILSAFPDVVRIEPNNLSTVTLSCRLRDAIAGLLRFRHTTTIDIKTLEIVNHRLVISDRGTHVLAGSAEKLKEPLSEAAPKEKAKILSVTTENTITIFALCHLLHERILKEPVRLATNLDVEVLIQTYDVSATKNKDGSFTLV